MPELISEHLLLPSAGNIQACLASCCPRKCVCSSFQYLWLFLACLLTELALWIQTKDPFVAEVLTFFFLYSLKHSRSYICTELAWKKHFVFSLYPHMYSVASLWLRFCDLQKSKCWCVLQVFGSREFVVVWLCFFCYLWAGNKIQWKLAFCYLWQMPTDTWSWKRGAATFYWGAGNLSKIV